MPQSSTSQSPETRLLETAEESRVYRRLHTAILKTTIKELIATSRLRATLAGLMSLVIWIALFFIMLEGFFFLQREAGAFTEETVEKVLNIFYASLMIMLFFSSAILIYGGNLPITRNSLPDYYPQQCGPHFSIQIFRGCLS